ncbi:PAS domain-containing protein [Fodinisporobacter ferrooxydans]|uniref:PAS domain-containing protein n=1 Tax=Fodinisporobacter ferrooxydans TaxID=2901836 RepID=A0ABY4CIX1_9BACL|nr:PAS domain-containing protein [Alicyclobacillaceae bacterium MYW30-H2]
MSVEDRKQPHRTKKRMTLRSKINWLVFLNIILVLTLVISVISYFFIASEFEEAGEQALAVARTVANMKQIRYSHPDPKLIGKIMEKDPGDNGKVLAGHSSITQAMGSLGLSVRGKAPIFDSLHHQIGLVSVGYLVSDIWDKIFAFLVRIAGLGVIALAMGLWGATLLSGHIKRQIFNMEPLEIAFLAQKQASILESIREGIIAVDSEGKISTYNQEAKRLLGLDSADVIGKSIASIIPNSRLPEV